MGEVRNVFTGRVLTLNLETVTLPNGVTVELEVIRHPGAAAVVPLKDDGTVILIKQYRHAAGGFIYEIPAGKLTPGEDPRACASRELEEEVGYVPGRLDLLVSLFTAPGFADEVIHIFRGTKLQPGRQRLDTDEVLEVLELPLEHTIGMIAKGLIRDAKSIVGLQTVYLHTLKP